MQGPVYSLAQEVLRTDVAGMPLEWIDYRVAATLYHSGQVAYSCGSPIYRIRGGFCAKSGSRSIIEVNSIIATEGDTRTLERNRDRYTPPLNNRTLFRRDANLCLYCGIQYRSSELTRDHVTPLSRGLPALQQSQRRAHARGSARPARRRAVHADVRGVHLLERPPRARGPDAVSAHALPAHEPAARALAQRARRIGRAGRAGLNGAPRPRPRRQRINLRRRDRTSCRPAS